VKAKMSIVTVKNEQFQELLCFKNTYKKQGMNTEALQHAPAVLSSKLTMMYTYITLPGLQV